MDSGSISALPPPPPSLLMEILLDPSMEHIARSFEEEIKTHSQAQQQAQQQAAQEAAAQHFSVAGGHVPELCVYISE